MESGVLINLASIEYYKSVKAKAIKGRIVTPVFKDYHQDRYQVIGFFAKKARGLMARYIIDEEITQVEALRQFNGEGYSYNSSLSNEEEWVFTRN
jgi:hypothetical protein